MADTCPNGPHESTGVMVDATGKQNTTGEFELMRIYIESASLVTMFCDTAKDTINNNGACNVETVSKCNKET